MPSLLEALENKYFANCAFEFENANEDHHLHQHQQLQHNDRDIDCYDTKCGAMEFSIFIPRLSPLMLVPELLVLNDCDIDRAGDFESIKEKCKRVRELDLAQNKLRDWREVFDILKHMPRIEFLNLSKNQLMGPISKPYVPPIANLKSIVLNGTYLDWMCIDALLENLPILDELHLSLNNYKEVLIDAADCANDNVNESNNMSMSLKAYTGAADSVVKVDEEPSACNANNCCRHLQKPNCESEQQPTEVTAMCHSCHDSCSVERNKCKNTNAHKSLKTLHFTGNPVECWQEICRLGRVFPNMENLVLADCPIKSLNVLTVPTDEGCCQATTIEPVNAANSMAKKEETSSPPAHKHFPNLKFLNLSYANLSTWHDIDQLAQFPKLRNLRVKHWPLWETLECTEHERRQLLIARLPNVAMLNGGGMISADEREDAERVFIRYYMEKPECERPTRYYELLAKHGKLDPLVNINLKPEKRVKVLFTYNETSESRSVDIYLTVSDLKSKLEKLLNLPANKMRLYYLDKDYKEFGPEEMRYPNKQLYSYNIQAGDEIIVDEKK